MIRPTAVLLSVLAAGTCAAADDDAWTQPARYAFEYRVDLAHLDVAAAQRLRVWVPYPTVTEDQKLLSAAIDAPWAHRLTTDELGNRIVYLEGRGVPERPLVMRFEVERAPSDGIPKSEVKPGTPLDPERYLRAIKLIPLEGAIRQVAEQESRGRSTRREKIRAFYDYVVRTMQYNKDGTGWGRGDAVWACSNKRGNCTDFHSLLIGMAQSQGIPARFVIGFPIPMTGREGPVGGYHCWAEWYDEERGWVPLDSSEAKKSGRPDAYFGTLPNDRIQFTIGRDLKLDPRQDGPPLNYFIYPYAEADGATVEKVQASFQFQRLPPVLARR